MSAQPRTAQPFPEQREPGYVLLRPHASVERTDAPDERQRRVVDHASGPLLVEGGPGTGKTFTLVHAVAERVRLGADPGRILVLTYGRDAATALRNRIVGRIGGVVTEPLARTFHSYAFGLLRHLAAARGEPTPRLLAGPEQDLLIRELLAGDAACRGVQWPSELSAALKTRGFAAQLRDLLNRAYERGIDPVELRAWGVRHERSEWVAAAAFMQQYADVTELRDATSAAGTAYDPAELIRAAITVLRRDSDLLAQQRERIEQIFVDEYQECDPAQEELLRLLTGGGRFLIAFGDPNQSLYSFRGADPDCVRRFPDRFTTAAGDPAPRVELRACHRSGVGLVMGSQRVAARIAGGHAAQRIRSALTETAAESGAQPEPAVAGVHVVASSGQEAGLIVALLRRAHVMRRVPWGSMAVIVRSAGRSVAALRRSLSAAGIPVVSGRSHIPLAEQPAVAPLLLLLRCVTDPAALDSTALHALLLTELGGADPIGLRRLRHELHKGSVAESQDPFGPPRDLLLEVTSRPELLDGIDRRWAAPLRHILDLLAAGRAAVAAPGASAETVLWALWEASGLAPRWQRRSTGSGTMAMAANRDLDAVLELFDAAAKFTDRMPGASIGLFTEHVSGQQLPADVLARDSIGRDGVSLITAHAAKGREWDLVVVAGVQEELWPALRLRGSVLGAPDLVELAAGRELHGTAARAAAYQQLIDDERRLFYVAVTRARHWLVATAVSDDDNTPSRFLDELDPLDLSVDKSRPLSQSPETLSLPALTARLRRELTQSDPPGGADISRRRAAAAVLAQLAGAGVAGAAPPQWWGLAPVSDPAPLVDPDHLVTVSPSALETFSQCELRWMLERKSGGFGPPGSHQIIGNAVHEVAALAHPGLDLAKLTQLLRDRLDAADLGTGWFARRQREKAEDMIRKLADWLASNPRNLVDTERDFAVEIGRARLTGRVDRLEADGQGQLFVVDFKTGSKAPTRAEIVEHPQLGAYQLAVSLGGFVDLDAVPPEPDLGMVRPAEPSTPAGAALIQLGGTAKAAREQRQIALHRSEDPAWAERLVRDVADGMSGAVFTATASSACGRCPVRSSCPLHSAQTTSVVRDLDDLDDDPGAPT